MSYFRFIAIVFSAFVTSACATLPTLQSENGRGVDVNQIVDATKCELSSIVKSQYAVEMSDWSAKVSLDLRVLYDNSGGPNAALIIPYYSGVVEANGALNAGAQSNRAGHLSYNVAKLKELRHLDCLVRTGIPSTPYDLGLATWLETAVASVTRPNDNVGLSELTYTLEFIVEQSISGDVRIRPIGGPTTGSAGIGGKASAKDTNTLLVTLVAPTPKPVKPDPTLVKIIDWPKSLPGTHSDFDKGKSLEKFSLENKSVAGRRGPASVAARPGLRAPRIDPYTQQRLDDLQVKQRLFNSITLPRSTLNAF